MTGCNFSSVACFAPDLPISEIGRQAHLLTRACKGTREAYEAAVILGDPQSRTKREAAQAWLDAMPWPARKKVLADYHKLAKEPA